MLNRNRPFGEISGPGCKAKFEQVDRDGTVRYYNTSGLEVDIDSGKVLEAPPVKKTNGAGNDNRAERARELLKEQDTIKPFAKFMARAAAVIGGDNPPTTKIAIIAELEKIASAATPVAVVAGPQRLADDETVNLRAWGRGDEDYVFSDVAREILSRYARNVNTRKDAIEALIDSGVISPDEAMSVAAEPSSAFVEDEDDE